MPPIEFMVRFVLSNDNVDVALVATTDAAHLAADVTYAAKGPLPIQLAYQGKPDLSDVLTLDATVGESKFHSDLRLPQVRTWLAADNPAPLPPLNGTLVSPRLNIEGIELKGVSVEIEDDPPAAAVSTKP